MSISIFALLGDLAICQSMSKSPSSVIPPIPLLSLSLSLSLSLVAAPARRPFSYFELCLITVPHGICGLYERKLKELNPALRNITYDIADLYNFIDGLADMSALVSLEKLQ
ncbi:enhancer of rudimentary homolog isoform X4 [Juglans microcarpa x Juglans regia]|uniref:enhancer of rudimentary homolog isoform X4 n=1 Tax=Juglans microcarpa x Juglans regia TaxID=2249226 RepID=UPI001B7E5E6C|nr:enhancer of rudimentary homolog isoform X4 [Juglans microcarpa x Juglans regia]